MIAVPDGSNYRARWTDATGTQYRVVATSRAQALLCMAEVAFAVHNDAIESQTRHNREAP